LQLRRRRQTGDTVASPRSLKLSTISWRPRFWEYEGFKIFTHDIGAAV